MYFVVSIVVLLSNNFKKSKFIYTAMSSLENFAFAAHWASISKQAAEQHLYDGSFFVAPGLLSQEKLPGLAGKIVSPNMCFWC